MQTGALRKPISGSTRRDQSDRNDFPPPLKTITLHDDNPLELPAPWDLEVGKLTITRPLLTRK
jgi:hypothetical protein